MKAAWPPAACASAIADIASVVLPADSAPKISTIRPRGNPPTPNAKSSAIDPVGIDLTVLSEDESPIRMTAPLPNAFSICARANSRVLSRSLLVPLT